ncbi:methyltransferase domain-containing protein [Moraxella nasovis]|uniref:putative RNA methyltransferase n=1 Tax=Moraxella nasovis TaxID=2904121 RepID=UPI001F60F4EC|nr:methyltransferase domain-containing protein [Moraxella nasovis]UNU74077.1 methyltransferase domain-containing protein [Moraxella nasovis]
MLACPICHTPLMYAQKSYTCQNRHSYDVSKDGYVNLHVVQHKRSHHAGDTPESVQARRRFLAGGFYEPLRAKIGEIIAAQKVHTALDIGCGEGYYTAQIAKQTHQVFALDIAKPAVKIAAKSYKLSHKNITWIVGTGSLLPITDNSVDLCTSLFSPLPKSEMLRVLKDGGLMLMATPAPTHLYALRQGLFDTVNLHEPGKFVEQMSPEFYLLNTWHVDNEMTLDAQALSDLIDMTPYAYKARLDKKTALKSLDGFKVLASFCVYLFKKCDT